MEGLTRPNSAEMPQTLLVNRWQDNVPRTQTINAPQGLDMYLHTTPLPVQSGARPEQNGLFYNFKKRKLELKKIAEQSGETPKGLSVSLESPVRRK
jgi:hypothetical protein